MIIFRSLVFAILTATICFFCDTQLSAQSYAVTVKGGPSIGYQRWDEGNRNALWAYHFALGIEGAPKGGGGAMYAQGGYHVRGSAIRFRPVSFHGLTLNQRTDKFEFNNLSIQLGFKNRDVSESRILYYYFGLRGEYTLSTNLKQYEDFVRTGLIYYPAQEFVRKFNYGISVGGGWEFSFSDYINGFIELSFHPDFSRQYDQPSIPNVIDPFLPGTTRTFPERRIVNYTGEISIGLRFLREITYID